MIEYEKKVMLTEDEYNSLVIILCKYSPMLYQTNYYFDSDDLRMNKKGITCRIRAKDGKYRATVKNHKIEHSDCSVEMDLVEKKEFDPQIFNVFGLRCQGELVTNRIVLYKDSTCEMVVDKNVYLGHTDVELEVEYRKGSEESAYSLIKSVAEYLMMAKHLTEVNDFLERIGKGKSKSQRFFERLKLISSQNGGEIL